MKASLAQTFLRRTFSVSLPDSQKDSSWPTLDPKEWECVLNWLDVSGLALYFRHQLEASDELGLLPGSVRARLDASYSANQARSAATVEEIRIICRGLEEAEVDYALLKGIALVPDYCPQACLRTQYDHDVLVDPASLNRAERALQKAGYRRKKIDEDHPRVYAHSEARMLSGENSPVLYSPRLARPVELHCRLWEAEEEKIAVGLPDDILLRVVRRRWDGLEYSALSDEDSLIFQALHAFRHILRNWCRLSVLLEIAQFLSKRRDDVAFWERFTGRLSDRPYLSEICGVVFELAASVFDAPGPGGPAGRLTRELPPQFRLWIERYGKASALWNFQENKNSLFLHHEFVQSPKDWADIRNKRLFPPRRPHRLPSEAQTPAPSAGRRLWKQCIHALRRAWFHVSADFRFVREYPRWTFLTRKLESGRNPAAPDRSRHEGLARAAANNDQRGWAS